MNIPRRGRRGRGGGHSSSHFPTGVRATSSFNNVFSKPATESKIPRYPFDGLMHTSSGGDDTPKNANKTPCPLSNSIGSLNKRFTLNSTNTDKIPKISSASRLGGITSGRSYTTPCSTTSNTTLADSCVIVAITEGRGAAKGEVGIAAIDIRKPHLILCQLSDTHSYIHSLTKLNFFNPVEIIVPHTFNSGVIVAELYKLIQRNFPKIRLTSVLRRCFSDANGLQQIIELAAPEYMNIQLQIVHKFYALTAAAALLKYVECIQCILFAPHSLKIEFHGCQNTTVIDIETTIRLELVESLSYASNRRSCLLSVLNYTHTAGGLRNLRANILQPPCDEKIINNRLDCIEELLQNNDGLMPALLKVMKQFFDVDKILWLCVLLPTQDGNKAGEAQLNHTLQLKTALDILPSLVSTLQMAKGRWFHSVMNDLEDQRYSEMLEKIKKVLHDDAHVSRGAGAHFQRCFAVRPDINGLLDVARRSYSELITDIQEKVTQLGETYDLPLRLNSNNMKGFHIVLSYGARSRGIINIKDLPQVFIEVQRHGNTITMTTEEIILMDQQARESLNEIQTMSNIIIYELLTELRSYMSLLYKLCEHVAELDMILSLAQVSSSGNYVRPIFNKYLELKDSMHPILESVLATSPVPNDVFSSPEHNFHVITGPNMGGKTIYIKQIALLQIMAQIGCFVPATNAIFRISDNIFSRIGFNDSIECNASTYVLEMKEMQYILQTLTPSSLIIIDELCRGTSSEEGTSMAWAICEQLLDSKAFTFFTTHFLYLTKLQDVYFNVINLHTETTILENPNNENGGLIYKYKILHGVTNIDHYGLALAKNTNLPKHVINLAEDLIKIISKQKKPLSATLENKTDEKLIYTLAAELLQESRKKNITTQSLNNIMNKFKDDNPKIMENIYKNRRESNDDVHQKQISSSYIKPSFNLKNNHISATSDSGNNISDIDTINMNNIKSSNRYVPNTPRLNQSSTTSTSGDYYRMNVLGENIKNELHNFTVISSAKRHGIGSSSSITHNESETNSFKNKVSQMSKVEISPLVYRHSDVIDYDTIFCEPDVSFYKEQPSSISECRESSNASES